MSDQGIKSKPAYGRIAGDKAARYQLLLVEGADIPAEALAEGIHPSAFETWTVARASALPAAPIMDEAPGAVRPFRSARHLMSALEERLDRETMGLRVYAIGTEPFLWDAFNIAAAAGLSGQETQFAHVGPKARRVYCVHCRTMSEGVTTSIFACEGCGAPLFVRDHFSKRLAAYMGVQVDAEAPGEVPAAEELYK